MLETLVNCTYIDSNLIDNFYFQNSVIFNYFLYIFFRFLDYNKIEVIEHLDNCPLNKLSLKGQEIDRSVVLGFDPLCMKKLKVVIIL